MKNDIVRPVEPFSLEPVCQLSDRPVGFIPDHAAGDLFADHDPPLPVEDCTVGPTGVFPDDLFGRRSANSRQPDPVVDFGIDIRDVQDSRGMPQGALGENKTRNN